MFYVENKQGEKNIKKFCNITASAMTILCGKMNLKKCANVVFIILILIYPFNTPIYSFNQLINSNNYRRLVNGRFGLISCL